MALTELKFYFTTVPAHKFMHIKNYESNGYFGFWEKQDKIEGADCCTVCDKLDYIKGKLDGEDGVFGKYSGQIMARIFEGDKSPEAYGVRLQADYSGEVPTPMLMLDVAESEYLVFEHGPFDYETECAELDRRFNAAIASFDFSQTEYELDNSRGRVQYSIFDPERHEKRLIPVKRR